eukprot:scaffold42990_cov56-Attheya_sp.AAC.6
MRKTPTGLTPRNNKGKSPLHSDLPTSFREDEKEDKLRRRHKWRNFRFFTALDLKLSRIGWMRDLSHQQRYVAILLGAFLVTLGIQTISTWQIQTRNQQVLHHHQYYSSSKITTYLHDEQRFLSRKGLVDLSVVGFTAKPSMVGWFFPSVESTPPLGLQRFDPYLERPGKRHLVIVSKGETEAELELLNSKEYGWGRAEPFDSETCKTNQEWQRTVHPTCNTIHETSLTDLHNTKKHNEKVRLINNGYWRDVWGIRDFDGEKHVLKTIRYEHDYNGRNYDRHRRDAAAMDRLTESPNIVDIFAFCGNSGVNEFSTGGTIEDAIFPGKDEPKLTPKEKLIIAHQVATNIADVHNIDGEGQASIAHTDITPGQFIWINGAYKLNDFNRCRFIRWNVKEDKPCGFSVGNNPGNFRAPEEYAYDLESEKVDIYSMGNIFYLMLTKKWPFQGVKDKEIYKKVQAGERPKFPKRILESKEPTDIVILKAIVMCWVQNPEKRATAREVSDFLNKELERIFPEDAEDSAEGKDVEANGDAW